MKKTNGISRQEMFLSKSTSALIIDCKHKTAKSHITFLPKAIVENRKRSAPILHQLPIDNTHFNILATSVCEPFDTENGSYYDSPLLTELSMVVKPSVTKLDITQKSTEESEISRRDEFGVKLPQPKKLVKKLVLAPIHPSILNIPVSINTSDLGPNNFDSRSMLSLESGCVTGGASIAQSPTNGKRKQPFTKRLVITDNLDRPISPMTAMGGRFSPQSASMSSNQNPAMVFTDQDTLEEEGSVDGDGRFRDIDTNRHEPFDDNLLDSDQLAQLSTSVLSRTPKPVVQPPVGVVSAASIASLGQTASLRGQPRVSKQQLVFGTSFEAGAQLFPIKTGGRVTQSMHSVVLPTTNSGASSRVHSVLDDSLLSEMLPGAVDANMLQHTISALSSIALSESVVKPSGVIVDQRGDLQQMFPPRSQQSRSSGHMSEIRYPLKGGGLTKTITPSVSSFAPRSGSSTNRRSVSPSTRQSPSGSPSRPRTSSPSGRVQLIHDPNQPASQTSSQIHNQSLPYKASSGASRAAALKFDMELDGDSINSEGQQAAAAGPERRTVGSRAQSPSGTRSRTTSGNKKTIVLRINPSGEIYDANAASSSSLLDGASTTSLIDVATINSRQNTAIGALSTTPSVAGSLRQKSRSSALDTQSSLVAADSSASGTGQVSRASSRVGSRSHLTIAGVSTELQQKSISESSTKSSKSPSKRGGSQQQVAYVLNPSGGMSVHSASVGSITRRIVAGSFDSVIADGESSIGSVSGSIGEQINRSMDMHNQSALPPPFFNDVTEPSTERKDNKPYGNVNNVGGGVVPFQVHKRIMGWKLTSLSRRRDLVSILDVVSNKDPRDIMSGHNVTGNKRRKNIPSVGQVKSSLLSMSQAGGSSFLLDHIEPPEMAVSHEELSALHARQSHAWQKSVSRLVKFRQSYSSVEAIKFLVDERKMRDEKRKNILRYGVLSRGADLVGRVDHMGVGLDEPDSFLQSWSRSPSRGELTQSRGRSRGRSTSPGSRGGSPLRPMNDIYNYPVNINRPRDRMDILNSVKTRSLLQTYHEQGREDGVIQDLLESKYRQVYDAENSDEDDSSQMSQDSSSRLLLHQERYVQSSAERDARAGGMTWNANVEADEMSQGLNMDDDLSSLGEGSFAEDMLNGDDEQRQEPAISKDSNNTRLPQLTHEPDETQSPVEALVQGNQQQQKQKRRNSSPIKLGDEASEGGGSAFQIPINNW